MPSCSPCGLPVEWGRSAYASTWRLFRDNPNFEIPGEYYESAHDADFPPFPTFYTSRDWYNKNWELVQGLGESLDAKHQWRPGIPPSVVPDANIVGSANCISRGELWANRIGTASLTDGVPTACFSPLPDPNLPWKIVSDYQSCSIQYFYAVILDWIYTFQQARIPRAFELLVGPAAAVTYHRGTTLIPDIVTVIHPTFSVAVVTGTTNFQQLALQAFSAISPPVSFGILETFPLWYVASNWVHNQLVADGMDASKPIMLVGHSYGAAAASVLAARYRAGSPAREIVRLTYGIPKPGGPKLRTLLDNTRGIDLCADADLVPTLPPNLLTLWAVYVNLGIVGLLLWTRWVRPNGIYLLKADGSLIANQSTLIDYATMLQFTNDALSGRIFPFIPAHRIGSYRDRTELRCPFPEWPVSVVLWNYLHGGAIAANVEIQIGVPAAELNVQIAIGGPGADLTHQLIIGGPGGETGIVIVGGPGGDMDDEVILGGPGADLTNQLIIGGPGGDMDDEVILGGPGADLDAKLIVGGPGGDMDDEIIVGGPGGDMDDEIEIGA